MYFTDCRTAEDVKTRYKELAKRYHPDMPGGDTKIMQEINDEFDRVFARLKNIHRKQGTNETYEEKDEKKRSNETPQMFREIITKLFSISQDIVIEICGTWLWLTGDTYPIREELKAIGCRWSKGKKKWYFTYDPYVKTRFTLSESARRFKYGSEFVEPSKFARIAN